jgi:ribosomal protein S18 acetylase RimI-like enzyme
MISQRSVLEPVPVLGGRGAICREVLEFLPEWFGTPASVVSYVAVANELPMLACFDPAGEVVGFVSVKTHTAFAAEVYVMGVKRSWHRHGIGRALIEAAVQLAISHGLRIFDREDALALERRFELRAHTIVLRGCRVSADRGISDPVEP